MSNYGSVDDANSGKQDDGNFAPINPGIPADKSDENSSESDEEMTLHPLLQARYGDNLLSQVTKRDLSAVSEPVRESKTVSFDKPVDEKKVRVRARFTKLKQAISGVSYDRVSDKIQSPSNNRASRKKRDSFVVRSMGSNSPTVRKKNLKRPSLTVPKRNRKSFERTISEGDLLWGDSTLKADEEEKSTIGWCDWFFSLRDTFLESEFFRSVRNPTGSKRRKWHVAILLCILYNLVTIPMRLGFTESLVSGEPYHYTAYMFLATDIITDVILLMHVFLSFYTPYEDMGFYITNNDQVFYHYLWGEFWIDFAAVLPLYLYDFDLRAHAMWRIPRLIWFRKYNYFFSVWEHAFVSAVGHFSMQFIKLIIMFLGITHWVACAFMAYSFYDGFSSEWQPPHSIVTEGFLQQYIYALYRAMDMCIGGSAADPTSAGEQLFVLVCMMINVFAIALIIGSIADIVAQLNKRDEQFRDTMDDINSFCLDRRLSHNLTLRIRKHVTTKWNRKGGVVDEQILSSLTPSLAREVNMQLNSEIIQNCPLFEGCPESFVYQLVNKLSTEIYSPNEVVVQSGDPGHEMYFIGRGKVDIVIQNDKVVGTLKEGDYFGEIALLDADAIRTASIVSNGYCDLFMLKRSDFATVTKFFPEQLSHMHFQAALRRTRSALITSLKSFPAFAALEDAEWIVSELTNKFHPVRDVFIAGDTVFDTMDRARHLYFIGQGYVEVRTRHKTHRKSPSLNSASVLSIFAKKQSVGQRLQAAMQGHLVGILGANEYFGWIDVDEIEDNVQNVHANIGKSKMVNGRQLKNVIFVLDFDDAVSIMDECEDEYELNALLQFLSQYSEESTYNNREYVNEEELKTHTHENDLLMRLAQLSMHGEGRGFSEFSVQECAYAVDYLSELQKKLTLDMAAQNNPDES